MQVLLNGRASELLGGVAARPFNTEKLRRLPRLRSSVHETRSEIVQRKLAAHGPLPTGSKALKSAVSGFFRFGIVPLVLHSYLKIRFLGT